MLQQDTDYLSLRALQRSSPHSYAYESMLRNMIVSLHCFHFQPDELDVYKRQEMMKVRNLGRKSLEEVINKLAMMGLHLADEDSNN